MKNILLLALSATVALLVTLVLVLPFVSAREEVIDIVITHEGRSLTPAQVIWLAQLMDCESGIKASAVNPNDLDNTPSYGILQFKTGTFEAFTAQYGLEGDIMDGNTQVAIVTKWILDGGVKWEQQFPACIRRLGAPPSN